MYALLSCSACESTLDLRNGVQQTIWIELFGISDTFKNEVSEHDFWLKRVSLLLK